MKKQLLFILTAFAVASSGCLKDKSDVSPVPQPQGKFGGQFIRVHKNSQSNVKDTVKYAVQIELTNNTFKFVGDTSQHAGSYGTFNYNQSYMEWFDATVPAGTNSLNMPKPHLNGLYLYVYDGNLFQFAASNDTLTYFYDLKKQ